MRTIVLAGDMNCGKTTTTRLVYDTIIAHSTTIEPLVQDVDMPADDFSALVEYNGLKVGFYSMGDNSRPVVAAIRAYRNKGADILVCTCRLIYVNPYKEMAKEGYDKVLKTVANDPSLYNEANESDAEQIIALLK